MKDLPEVGSVWSFRTRPLTEFSPETGRYAALKVVGRPRQEIVVVTLDGIWRSPPTLEEIAGCGLLEMCDIYDNWDRDLACLGVSDSWWHEDGMCEFVCVGVLPLRPVEAGVAEVYAQRICPRSYAPVGTISLYAERAWRKIHDRDAMDAELRRLSDAREATRRAEEERYRTRLRGLTWEMLLAETPFARWDPSPPFPPAAFRDAAAAKIHDTCRALQALGPKPKRADVRRLLKACIDWFNAADAEAGEVIETEEREDICLVLEEMAHVARQKALVEEIDEWRSW